jgi:hypothetical protein
LFVSLRDKRGSCNDKGQDLTLRGGLLLAVPAAAALRALAAAVTRPVEERANAQGHGGNDEAHRDLFAALLVLFAAHTASAQSNYPNRPVKFWSASHPARLPTLRRASLRTDAPSHHEVHTLA